MNPVATLFIIAETDLLSAEDGSPLTAEDGDLLITQDPNPNGPPDGP